MPTNTSSNVIKLSFKSCAQVIEQTDRAIGLCKRIGSPPGPQRQVIQHLYPASTGVVKKVPIKRKFNPTEISIAEQQKKKKKAAVVKPRTVSVVLLNKHISAVPKGKSRKSLLVEGRIRKVSISRMMCAENVHSCICNAFSDSVEMSAPVVFLCTGRDNSLDVFQKQDLDGSELIELAGGGSVYLLEVSVLKSLLIKVQQVCLHKRVN